MFKKIPHTILRITPAQTSWKNFFFENYFFQGLGVLPETRKPLIWVSFFSTKYQFYTFFQVRLFNFNITLKTYFENVFRKIMKNW